MTGRVPIGPDNPDDTPHVTLADGVAGAGKTSDLLEVLDEEVNRSLDPYKFRYVLFGSAAAGSVADRIGYNGDQPIPQVADVVEESQESDSGVDRPFRTFNSLALAAAKNAGVVASSDDIIVHDDACSCGANNPDDCTCAGREDDHADEHWYKQFFAQHAPGVEFSAKERDPLQIAGDKDTAGIPTGNKLMSLYQYCQSQGWTIEDVVGDEDGYKYHAQTDVPVDVAFHPTTVIDIFHAWDDYKAAHGIIEHNDYMVAAANADASIDADIDVLFIDEFQDLSPLMYYLYQTWADDCERVYLAGDGDQAIMGFRGSTDKYINNTAVDDYVPITQSYRCGQNILNLAGDWLDRDADITQHPDSHASEGEVRDVYLTQGDNTEFANLVRWQVDDHGDVMLLSRTVRGVGYLAHSLREAGIPYSGIHDDGSRLFRWDDPMGQMLDVARMFNNQDRVPVEIVAAALRQVKDDRLTQEGRRIASLVPGDEVESYGSPLVSFQSLLDCVAANTASDMVDAYDVDDWERELLHGAVGAGTSVRPGDVRIGTIHAAKGEEAGSVVLDCAYTRNLREQFRRSSRTEAEERRLYYVAATRAKEELIALHDFRGGVESPLVEDGVESVMSESVSQSVADD